MYIKITLLSLPFLVSTFHHTAAYALFTESSPSHFRVLSQNSRICSTKTKPALFSSRGQSDESNEHDEFPPKKSNASMEQNTTLNSLGHLLRPSSNCRVDQLSPTALAYIGDSVFELFIRSRYVWPNRRTSDLQNKVVGIVRGMYFWIINFYFFSGFKYKLFFFFSSLKLSKNSNNEINCSICFDTKK